MISTTKADYISTDATLDTLIDSMTTSTSLQAELKLHPFLLSSHLLFFQEVLSLMRCTDTMKTWLKTCGRIKCGRYMDALERAKVNKLNAKKKRRATKPKAKKAAPQSQLASGAHGGSEETPTNHSNEQDPYFIPKASAIQMGHDIVASKSTISLSFGAPCRDIEKYNGSYKVNPPPLALL